jgi:hypothetical protein
MKTKWPADKTERRSVDSLIPYARNSRVHSNDQVKQIASSIKEWGFTNPVLIEPDGGIIAGHGRVMAAKLLGLSEVPCVIAEGWTEPQKRAYVIADNKLAEQGSWDQELLSLELKDIELSGFDMDLIGFDGEVGGDDLDFESDSPSEELSENYSRKIEAPIYEITGKCPSIPEMMDRSKTETLQAEIGRAGLPEDVRAFLHFAAERHTVFNFRNIAEFYAHADADTQNLMERSALVIIDFDRAIEEGFVELSKELMNLAGQEHG